MTRARRGGFTLIELLVVIVILGGLVGLAVLSVGSSHSSREVRDEAQRLAALITVLADEAVLDGREYGLLIDDEGYRVLHYEEASGRWVEADRREAHRVPEWMRLQLELDGTPLRLVTPVRERDDPAGLSDARERAQRRAPPEEPQLLILSSGELSPFSLTLADRGAEGVAWRLSSDGFRMPVAEPLEGADGS